MKSKLSIAVVLLAVATMLPASVVAGREGKRSGRAARGLGLDDTQIERIGRLRVEHRLGMIDGGAELRKLRLALRAELAGSSPDRAELDRITGAIGEVRAKMQKQRIDHLLKVRAVLDDDQWKRFIERRRNGRDRRPREHRRDRRAVRRITGRGDSGRGCIRSL